MTILDVVVLPADMEEPIKSTMGVVKAGPSARAAQSCIRTFVPFRSTCPR